MKKLFFSTVFLLAFAILATAQSNDVYNFIKSYAGGDNITTVFISPSMLKMMKQEAKDDDVSGEEFQELIKNFEGMSLLVAETDGKTYYSKFKEQIDLSSYEDMMLVQSDGEYVHMVSKTNDKDMIEEFIMVVYSDNEFVLIDFRGLLDMEMIQKIGNMMDIDMENLEGID